MSSVHARRVEQEWLLLARLAACNPDILEVHGRQENPDGEVFDVTLHRTTSVVREPDGCSLFDDHRAAIHLRPFFPSVPIEVGLARPVFHPNVNPRTGFVCLWGRYSPGDTVMEALAQLQRVLTWQLLNRQSVHLMQPEALEWQQGIDNLYAMPLPCAPLTKPMDIEYGRRLGMRPARYTPRLERPS
jgi:hypothetical protein